MNGSAACTSGPAVTPVAAPVPASASASGRSGAGCDSDWVAVELVAAEPEEGPSDPALSALVPERALDAARATASRPTL